MENGKLCWECILNVFPLKVLLKHVPITMHPKSRQVEVYMGSDTGNVIDTLFNTL